MLHRPRKGRERPCRKTADPEEAGSERIATTTAAGRTREEQQEEGGNYSEAEAQTDVDLSCCCPEATLSPHPSRLPPAHCIRSAASPPIRIGNQTQSSNTKDRRTHSTYKSITNSSCFSSCLFITSTLRRTRILPLASTRPDSVSRAMSARCPPLSLRACLPHDPTQKG